MGVQAEYERFRRALAIAESSDNPHAIGEGGRAWGRYQMHPAWLVRYHTNVYEADSWDDYQERALRQFFKSVWTVDNDSNADLDLRRVAMQYHVGHIVNPLHPDWDNAYDDRFTLALTKVTIKMSVSKSSVRKSSVG